MGSREDGGTASPPPGRMFPETHRSCLEEECPSLSHFLKLGRGAEGWKSQPFYPFLVLHLCLSPSLSSVGLFLFLCSSSLSPSLALRYIISTPALRPQPHSHLHRSSDYVEGLWPRLICVSYAPGCRAWPRDFQGSPLESSRSRLPGTSLPPRPLPGPGGVLSGAATVHWDPSMASLSCLDFPDFVWETNSS